MSRLFTFGCSFTKYHWPTWANILGKEYHEHQNWAEPGAGNQFILNSLVECNLRNKISNLDTVGIMWTNVAREDRYLTYWSLPGNIYTQDTYDEKFVRNMITTKGLYIRDLAFIYSVDKILKDIGCRYFYLSMVDITNPLNHGITDVSEDLQELFDLYTPVLKQIKPSIHNLIFNYDWNSRPAMLENGKRHDYHPLPLEHIEYMEKVIPEYKISDTTLTWAKQVDSLYRTKFTKEDLWGKDSLSVHRF